MDNHCNRWEMGMQNILVCIKAFKGSGRHIVRQWDCKMDWRPDRWLTTAVTSFRVGWEQSCRPNPITDMPWLITIEVIRIEWRTSLIYRSLYTTRNSVSCLRMIFGIASIFSSFLWWTFNILQSRLMMANAFVNFEKGDIYLQWNTPTCFCYWLKYST